MIKMAIIIFLLLGYTLGAEVFEFNTDIKSKYKFDNKQNNKNAQMAKELKMFQSGNASDEDIQTYLRARDNNESEPIEKDIMIEYSLKHLYELHEISKELVLESQEEDETFVIENENVDTELEVEDNETIQLNSNKEVEL